MSRYNYPRPPRRTKGAHQLHIEELERQLADERQVVHGLQAQRSMLMSLVRSIGELLQISNTRPRT